MWPSHKSSFKQRSFIIDVLFYSFVFFAVIQILPSVSVVNYLYLREMCLIHEVVMKPSLGKKVARL